MMCDVTLSELLDGSNAEKWHKNYLLTVLKIYTTWLRERQAPAAQQETMFYQGSYTALCNRFYFIGKSTKQK